MSKKDIQFNYKRKFSQITKQTHQEVLFKNNVIKNISSRSETENNNLECKKIKKISIICLIRTI